MSTNGLKILGWLFENFARAEKLSEIFANLMDSELSSWAERALGFVPKDKRQKDAFEK